MSNGNIQYYQGNAAQEYYQPAGSKRSRADASFPNDDYSDLQENTEYTSQDSFRYTNGEAHEVIDEDQLEEDQLEVSILLMVILILFFFFFFSNLTL